MVEQIRWKKSSSGWESLLFLQEAWMGRRRGAKESKDHEGFNLGSLAHLFRLILSHASGGMTNDGDCGL